MASRGAPGALGWVARLTWCSSDAGGVCVWQWQPRCLSPCKPGHRPWGSCRLVPLSSPCGKGSVPGDGRGASRARLVPKSPALRPGVQGPRLAPPPPRLPTPRRSWPSSVWLLGGRCQLGLSFPLPPQRAGDSPRREHARVPGVGHVPAGEVCASPGCFGVVRACSHQQRCPAPWERQGGGDVWGAAGGCPGVRRGHSWGQRPRLGAVTMADRMCPTSQQCRVGLGLCTVGCPDGRPAGRLGGAPTQLLPPWRLPTVSPLSCPSSPCPH